MYRPPEGIQIVPLSSRPKRSEVENLRFLFVESRNFHFAHLRHCVYNRSVRGASVPFQDRIHESDLIWGNGHGGARGASRVSPRSRRRCGAVGWSQRTVRTQTWSVFGQEAQEKLRQLVHMDLWNFSAVEQELTGFEACFFCLGVSSAGMTEEQYRRVTYDITLAAAETLVRLNPGMTFIYVSGAGTDSTAKGRKMWARVKGETENSLLRLPWKAAYMFRPAGIRPLHGISSRTRAYRIAYAMQRRFSRYCGQYSSIRYNHRTIGTGDAVRCEERISKFNPRSTGYWSSLKMRPPVPNLNHLRLHSAFAM